MRPLRTIPLLSLLAVLLLTGAGCVPNVSWLPDSSGFVCANDRHQLVHYDIAKRARKVVVADTGALTVWPAVSPDGKRIAVARCVANKDTPDTIEIILWDFQGKQVRRSQRFRWSEPSADANGNPKETFLLWSPRTEHLIVVAGGNTGIYDVRNDGLIVLDDAFPFLAGPSPVRPDGDGFLFCRKVGEQALKYAFVNWEGRERDIAMQPVAGDAEWAQFPLLFDSRWEGSVAVVRNGASCLRLDAERFRGSLEGGTAPELPAEAEVRQQVVFANNAVLRVLQMRAPDGSADRNRRVEFRDGPEGTPRALIDRAEYCLVFPAPNRKLVAVRCNPAGKGDRIIIIDERGAIVAEVPGEG